MDEERGGDDGDEVPLIYALASAWVQVEEKLGVELDDPANHIEISETEPVVVIKQSDGGEVWEGVVWYSRGAGYVGVETVSRDKNETIQKTKEFAEKYGLPYISSVEDEFVSIQNKEIQGRDCWILTTEYLGNGKTTALCALDTQEQAVQFGKTFVEDYNRAMETQSPTAFAPYFWHGQPERGYIAKFPTIN